MITDQIIKILKSAKNIAIVGCSRDPGKDSYIVAKFLNDAGFTIIPVNPFADEIMGLKSYKSLSEVKCRVDIVNIFRPSFEVLPIIEEAVSLKPALIWMQIGITSRKGYDIALKKGIQVVMDKCIMVEYRYSIYS
jgi:predicted CoA-binding protein